MDENQNNELEDVFSSVEKPKEENISEFKQMPEVKPQDNMTFGESSLKEVPVSNTFFIVILVILVIIGAFFIWTFLK